MATAKCICGACEVSVPEKPGWVVFCHCSQCRRALSADFATLCGYNPDQLVVTKGEENMTSYATGKEIRYTCNTCGSKVWADLQHLKQKAVYLTMFRNPNHGPDGKIADGYKPTAHIFYTSGIRSVYDNLPKFVDLPGAFGGSDKQVPENYFDAMAGKIVGDAKSKYTFTVGGQGFKTNLKQLEGKVFSALDEYSSFLNQAPSA